MEKHTSLPDCGINEQGEKFIVQAPNCRGGRGVTQIPLNGDASPSTELGFQFRSGGKYVIEQVASNKSRL
jgi:hypothetical protein